MMAMYVALATEHEIVCQVAKKTERRE